jgi:hypothetical protein
MERFTFVSAYGRSIVIDYDGPNVLEGYEGIGRGEVIQRATSGYKRIGNTLQETKYGIRIMTITFSIEADTMTEAYMRRSEMGSVFNPLAGEGILTYENNAVRRSIKCEVTQQPDPTERSGLLQQYQVELTAQESLWFDPDETVRLVQDFVSGLRFPIRFNPTIRFSRRGDALNSVNTGDVPAPIRTEFRGGCTNPRIVLTNTGEFIKIGYSGHDITLLNTDKLIVDTAYGNKTANLIHEDGTIVPVDDYIDDSSNFFSLPIGPYKVTFMADAGSPQAYIAYRNWYISGA